ncbi:hypothetical protein DFR86_00185 [Acidianus sulfidivorans JP7]|uniref:Uncharacterized protein n=1 Tax=Acidianus sulfidivorans JP7 TaxID=619593 RepID=A0A2U9IJD2_9CREN|nr:hypothetical protein [Acidianus sulfidivorans]AWR96120.1 hypothetical protein DFR86_00185 [Acidianus sulfidivorans JP7]
MKTWKLITITSFFFIFIVLISSFADVSLFYQGKIYVETTKSPIIVNSGKIQECNFLVSSWTANYTGFNGVLVPLTLYMSTFNGYIYVTHALEPLMNFTFTTGELSLYSSSPSITNATLRIGNETEPIYKTTGTFSLTSENYFAYLNLTFKSPIFNPIKLYGDYNHSYNGVTYAYNFMENIQPLTGNVMNALNGYSNFYVPHIYQGVISEYSLNEWPSYYYLSNSYTTYPGSYWTFASQIVNPVLCLVPYGPDEAGIMLWNERYQANKPVTMTAIGVYALSSSSKVADGYEFYLFINPKGWSISPIYNYSVPYALSIPGTNTQYSNIQGEIILPSSSKPYLEVQWDPIWQTGSSGGEGGQWNIWIVKPNGKVKVVANGYGQGVLETGSGLNPYDFILLCVTYNPLNNTVSGIAYDLNTGVYSTFSISLNGYFNPQPSGTYVFGIAGNTGGDNANWGLLYLNYTN